MPLDATLTVRAATRGEDAGRPLPLPVRAERGLVQSALRRLERAFGQPFWLIDVASGEISVTAPGIAWDIESRIPLLASAVVGNGAAIVENEPPLLMLATPLSALEGGATLVAVGVFAATQVETERAIETAARLFGVDAGRAFTWARQAEPWTPAALVRLADATLDNLAQGAQLAYLEHEINEAVAHARDTYAELGLLHRLTRRLALSEDDGQLWRRAVQWLAESVPAQCLAIVAREGSDRGVMQGAGLGGPTEVIHGQCPLAPRLLAEMLERLGSAAHRPLLLNRSHTSSATWAYPTVREVASTPIFAGAEILGWLAAINHTGESFSGICEFGSAEIRLLESVSTILGVHRSNASLFHNQADLFGAAVRSLITAIDAKDRYTHGHSERVARVSVCLAEQLHLSRDEINTIYLGGLLHDIGKIGVDDRVLNKPGPLTAEEFEQIKAHPQLGYDILRGVRQLERILPIVLHHHEAWDGSGYPHGLRGDQTPLLARVAAVADAFDAMSTSRPYRQGMSDEKLNTIFREGAGRQWDPLVVEAFFSVREDVRQAAQDAAVEPAPLDPFSWIN